MLAWLLTSVRMSLNVTACSSSLCCWKRYSDVTKAGLVTEKSPGAVTHDVIVDFNDFVFVIRSCILVIDFGLHLNDRASSDMLCRESRQSCCAAVDLLLYIGDPSYQSHCTAVTPCTSAVVVVFYKVLSLTHTSSHRTLCFCWGVCVSNRFSICIWCGQILRMRF